MHKTPRETGLSDHEFIELVAYHEMKNELAQNCPICVEKWRGEYKECTICGIRYNERGDILAETDEELERVQQYEFQRERERATM